MISTYCTFWDLLPSPDPQAQENGHKLPIQIPIIQRDYAQGRDDEKARLIRYKFIHDLHQVLENPSVKALDLDFVYGDIRDGFFIPLDGQQRLTTLFLLHWYLATVEGHSESVEARLSHFTYETRSSSRIFCQKLVTSRFEKKLKKHKSIGALIRNAAWFQPTWEHDPTVRGMLSMLEGMQQKFGVGGGLFNQLTDSANPRIGFQFLELKNAGLTDELYLKMNARGKPLTSFEIWKAAFDLFLQQNHSVKRHAEFGLKTDKDWTDLFWPFKDSQSLVDTSFERFVGYITRMLDPLALSQSNELVNEKEDPFERYVRIYTSPEHVDFLFGALDFLYASAEEPGGIDGLFSGIFSANEYQNGKVAFFGNNINLLKRCVDNKEFGLKSQLLLFTILYYAQQHSIRNGRDLALSTGVHDLLRVVRNLIEHMRWRSETRLVTSLEPENLVRYLDFIKSLVAATTHGTNVYEVLATEQCPIPVGFTEKALAQEKAKAQFLRHHQERKEEMFALEELPVFRGTLYNLDIEQNYDKLVDFRRAMQEIWSGQIEAGLIIRALLTQGDYAPIFGWSVLGYKYFFGNQSNWATLLTHTENDKIKNVLPGLLTAYIKSPDNTPEQKLLDLINVWLRDYGQGERNWRYHFIKYEEMTSQWWGNYTGYYAWEAAGEHKLNFNLRLLNRDTLKGYHINPYVRTVALQLEKQQLAEVNNQFKTGNERSPLLLADSQVMLHCQDKGWRLELAPGYVLSPELELTYLHAPDEKGRTFLKSHDCDRVELAVSFATSLLQR